MSIPELSGPVRKPASGGPAKQLILFLHGWGADGANLIELASLMAPHFPDAQFAAPNGPQACEVNPEGYQWFSLMDRDPARMLAGARSAAEVLNHYVDTQMKELGLSETQVALVGFSQGTMTSLHAVMRRSKAVSCLVGFSGALVAGDLLKDEIVVHPPVCLIHGDRDDVVSFDAMGHAKHVLESNKVPVETHARPNLGHSIDMQGVEIATHFIKGHLL